MIHKIYPRDQIKYYLLLDVFSVVFLFYFVLSARSALGLLGSLLLLLLFMASFYIALWRRDWLQLAAIVLGLAALAILAVHAGPNILLFGFIFADLLGRSKSKWNIGLGIAAIGIMFLFVSWQRADLLFQRELPILLPIMIVQMMLPIVIYINVKTRDLQGELDAANKQLIQQEERKRIARDLHDTLGQTLTMIKLKSELAAKWVDKDPREAKAELQDILATSRIALKQVRELVSDMKFASLAGELEQSRKLLHTAGIELDIVENGKPPLLSSVEETMIALSVREAVTNIVKHSRASQCTIKLETVDRCYCIDITDNGVGPAEQASGNGIASMNERMQALHGTLAVNHAPGGGTAIAMKLPLRRQGKENSAS
ncbi:Sensor histidine kinase DesK [Paenibacillus sp. CECT 9249]|uniref:sensor histidine kinase n=1 Tax=Paenibacillus sp. CECT 9249 TaxID=2845385 RepID=UPI001E4D3A66|nr:sensor histidine kinase [Paenibacillus sp. CECT 9249]CAH0119729.1 Sensor histidine kinase DesK [Paenibacillus sp. CECT 9249]